MLLSLEMIISYLYRVERHPYPQKKYEYSYRFRVPDSLAYDVSWTEFMNEQLEVFNWNYMDQYICTHGEDDTFQLTDVTTKNQLTCVYNHTLQNLIFMLKANEILACEVFLAAPQQQLHERDNGRHLRQVITVFVFLSRDQIVLTLTTMLCRCDIYEAEDMNEARQTEGFLRFIEHINKIRRPTFIGHRHVNLGIQIACILTKA